MTSPLPIPLSDVTQAGEQQRQTQVTALSRAYASAIQRRRAAAAALVHARAVHDKRVPSWLAQYQQAAANERDAANKYKTYQTGTFNPYNTEYTKLTQLGATNPTMDAILGKLTPYDPQSAVDRMNAATTRSNTLQQITQGRQQLNEDYANSARQAEDAQSGALRGLLGNFAGRGMAYSSGYGNAVGEQNRSYANYTGQLASTKQRGLAGADANEAAAQSNYLGMIGQALVGATGRLAGQAGRLGLGSTDLPYYTELARRKLAAGG